MKTHIALITLVSPNLAEMVTFYRDALDFPISDDRGTYVEFTSEGVRFSICKPEIMVSVTGDEAYHAPRQGRAFELAFEYDSPAQVDAAFRSIIAKGGEEVKAPERMPWGQYTGFFADPDGNVHEVFCDLASG